MLPLIKSINPFPWGQALFNRKGIVVMGLCALLFCGAGTAHAQALDISKTKKILHLKTLSDADFRKQTDPYRQSFDFEPALDFEIRLPRGFSKVRDTIVDDTKLVPNFKGEITTNKNEDKKRSLNENVLERIAIYYGPTQLDAPTRFEISAQKLTYETTTRNWFINHVIASGYTLEGMEQVNDRRIEALYVIVEGSVSYIVRTVAEINGRNIILASYYVPDSRWNDEKAMQEKVLQSFRLTKPQTGQMEQIQHFDYLDLLTISYPISWRMIAPKSFTLEGVDLRLVNIYDKKVLNGQIDIHIVSTELDTTLAQEVDYLRNNLKETQLNVGQLLEVPSDYKFGPHVYFNRVEVYSLVSEGNNIREHEYWLGVMAEDRYYYLVSMITPSRKADFALWARNTEAFDTIVKSIKPFEYKNSGQ